MYAMSRVARRIYSDDAKGAFRKGEAAPKATPPAHYNWEAARQTAARGETPSPPKVDAQRRRLLGDIMRLAAANDRSKLRDLAIPSYNSHVRALSQYRDVCLIALKARDG
jgi:hypothetical protein